MPASQSDDKASQHETPADGETQIETSPSGEPTPPPPQPTNNSSVAKNPFDISKLVEAMFVSLRAEPPAGTPKARDELIHDYLRHQIDNSAIADTYNFLILHDEGRMVKSDADNIYSAATGFSEKRPLMLVLYSTGGVIGSAYLIGKLCHESANGRFVVVVPRQAKSAATLLCCAADEIHMGSLSELGPIDPQIDNLPALGLKTSVEHIADLIKRYPHAADMFAKYLHMSLEPIHLGYYERVAESASQYAERLLKLHAANLKQTPVQIAKDLVYSYKDHGFVIDKAEASDIFGDKVLKTDTEEYKLGNDIYAALMFVAKLADLMDHYFYFIGSPEAAPHFTKRNRRA